MPRALQVFTAEGFDALPIAVDNRQNFDHITAMDFIPSAEALNDMSHFVQELIGRAYYACAHRAHQPCLKSGHTLNSFRRRPIAPPPVPKPLQVLSNGAHGGALM